jgi:hypothetical protein
MDLTEERFYELALLGEDAPERPILKTFVTEMVPESWRLAKGDPMSAIWPIDARIYMTGNERGLELCELIGTTKAVIIAGLRFKELLEKHCPDGTNEYLPVAIHDHRKRLLSDEYCIVNPLGVHDCVDLEKSDVLWESGPGSRVVGAYDLVIDRQRGAKAPQLFRPQYAPMNYVLRRALVRDIIASDLSNVGWKKLGVSG